MKTNLDWFPFRVDTLNSLGFKTLLRKFGFSGVGKLVVLKAIVAHSDNCQIDLNDSEVIEQLELELDLEQDLEVFIKLLVKTKIIHSDNGIISFIDINEKLDAVIKHRKRNQKKTSAQKNEVARSNEKQSEETQSFSADLDRVEKSRVEKSREEKRKVDKSLIEKVNKKNFSNDLKVIVLEILDSNSWIEKTCLRFNFSQDVFEKHFFDFADHVHENDFLEGYAQPKTDLKRHFTNWMKKQSTENQKETSDWSHLQVLD